MNKKILLFFFLFFISICNIPSQQKEEKMLLKNEFHLNYGLGSLQQLTSLIEDALFGLFSSDEIAIKHSIGPIIIGYKRNIGLNLNFGIEYSYTYYESDYLDKQNNSINAINYKYFHLLMLNGNFIYVTNKWVQMYSGVNFGFIYNNNTTYFSNNKNPSIVSGTAFAYQLNIFSLRAGNKYGGFFELGFGCNGIINLGFSYKF